MTDPIDLIAEATQYQQLASSPDSSVFVSANAGTGKTKVLTDRVLRLLIVGAPPESILCMTFTKAAAVEMSVRLNQKLADWAVCSESALIASLQEMGEARPKQEQIQRARALFAQILDTDDGPRIETVHSFCQSILSRFPIEAGIPAHFQMASEADVNTLLRRCFTELLAEPGSLADALTYVAGHSDTNQLFTMIKDALSGRKLMRGALDDPLFMTQFGAYFADELGCADSPPEPETLLASLDMELLARLAADMALGGVRQKARSNRLAAWLALAPSARCQQISELAAVFGVAILADKPMREAVPGSEALQQQIAEQIAAFLRAQAGAITRQKSEALMRVLIDIFRRYQALKFAHSLLDFDDLIEASDHMLARDQMLDWVRWKLDNGIAHLLVDEAQDTSPAQWSLISKLVKPFFEDEPDGALRTLFAVGDFKQSIYRFQGADPAVFLARREAFHLLARETQKPMKNVQFSASFRSASAVLQFVDSVMSDPSTLGIGTSGIGTSGIGTSGIVGEYANHKSIRSDLPSFVDIWPVQSAEKSEPPPPFAPPEPDDTKTAPAKQAAYVADKIAAMLASSSDNALGRQIMPSDIMILVRRRDIFYALLRSALLAKDIPVAPADRVKLINQIEILDLLALGDVCLLPEDDLQLAAVLKSPLFGLDDDDLMVLAIGRGEAERLFHRLLAHQGKDSKIGRACGRLLVWRDLADWLSPFAFFSQILIADGGRRAFYQRLGSGVMDTLDVFLSLARDHAQQGAKQGGQEGGAGLTGFLHQIRTSDVELKRDMAAIRDNQVRIMTIHGAKGLESPILILPDMLRPKNRTRALATDGRYLYWPHIGDMTPPFIAEMRDAGRAEDDKELDRLLYVALTRAEQGLVIGGFVDSNRRWLEDSWYARLHRIMQDSPDTASLPDGTLRLISGRLVSGKLPSGDASVDVIGEATGAEAGLPTWFQQKPKAQIPPPRTLNPSQPVPTDARPSSVASDAKIARERGNIVHALLEWLPAVEAARRDEAIARFWSKRSETSKPMQAQINQEVQNLLDLPELAELFGANAMAEVPIVGLVQDIPVSGQIDRLLITKTQITIVDFKSGAPPKNKTYLGGYHRQLALYAALLAQIYPQHQINSYLVWTRDCKVTCVTQEEREAALASLNAETHASAS